MAHKKRRLSVSIGRTVNLGNYNSIKMDATYSAVIKDDEDVEEMYGEFEEIVIDQLDSMLEDALERRINRTKEENVWGV